MNSQTIVPYPGVFARAAACLAALFLALASSNAEQVIFTEVHYNPLPLEPEYIEFYNNTSTPFDMGTWYFSDGVDFTFPDFDPGDSDAHILKAFEHIVVTNTDEATLRAAYTVPASTRVFGPYVGSLSNAGETLTLNDKNGIVMAQLSYDDEGKWPVAPDGTGHSLVRINNNLARGEWRNWRASALPGGTPGAAPPGPDDLATSTEQVAETTSIWRYDQNEANNDLGTAWRELGYNDDNWAEGPGIFGLDSGDVFGTPWTRGGRITYYLRREFQWDGAFVSAAATIAAHIDDGVVFYLNGNEITRFNMPGGVIGFETAASVRGEWDTLVDIVTDADITNFLQVGTNVLAVEVHNEGAGSSDIAFGANISITAAEPPAGAPPALLISEIHIDADGKIDWIELHAPANAIDATGLTLASISSGTDATPLAGNIPAGGYQSFEVDFLPAENGNIDIFLAAGDTIIDARKVDRDLGQESFQALPQGGEFYGGQGHTRDAANNANLPNTDIVINEIMYDTPSDQRNGEFIEVYNRGASSVDLSDWRFTAGIGFDFPPGTSIAPNGYLVIAADAACISSAHGGITVLGDWSGTLRDGGELIQLRDNSDNLVDEVDYKPAGDWPNMADGDGASMELRHPDMDNYIATAWADSDESQKSTMQTFSYTADFERAKWNSVSGGQELHTHLVGDAHVILENISLEHNNAGQNLVTNAAIMSPDNLSSKGWVCQGTHFASFFDAGKLNLISDGHGDNKANRAEVDMGALTIGQSYTLTFDARWVSGKSRIIFQTLDHAFGTTFLLPIPDQLGTPGAANSSLLASSAPTVTGVTHSPAVPKQNAAVTVSTRVTSSAALTSVEVVHRLDNNSGNGAWIRSPMTEDGTGLYSASISNHGNNGDIVQFYIDAKSGNSSTFQPRFGAERPAMWIVDSRDMPDVFLRERFIVSDFDRAALNTGTGHSPTFAYNFPRMSNHFFNATFISNESEIYYNAEIRKSGSPFTRSTNANIDHGKWKLPGDRLFRGRRRSVIDASGTNEGSGTPRFYDDRIARYFLYQLGHPTNEMEFVHSVINNLAFKIRENQEPISNDMLDRNFPGGSDGTLLRIDDEWRFTNDDGNQRTSRNADWSYKDSDNPVRYHSEWIMRSRESDYDYGTFIEWVRTLDENTFDEETINRIADADMLCINAAVRGYDADWDTITVNRGKNAYFFRPKEGKGWMLLHWDGDRVFENTGQAIIGGRTGVGTYFNKPYIKRRLNYYLTTLLDEHTKGSARTEAWMQAQEDAVQGTAVADGGSGVQGSAVVSTTMNHYRNWFNSRETVARDFVTNSVNNTAFAISTSNAATNAHSIALAGTASPDIFAVRVLGQPAATFHWVNTTDWTLSGVQLQSGLNALDVEGIDHDGNVVDMATFSITKNNNAPAVVNISADPRSRNVSLGETLALDAGGSYDPEGGALTFGWSVTPATGVNLVPGGATVSATFTQPGLYTFTATATDDQPQAATRDITIAVYGPESFSTFGDATLEGFWDFSGVTKHANASNTPHYSLQDNPGRLTINIPLPSQLEANSPVQYIDYGASWAYDDSGDDLTGIFAAPGFDDSLWRSEPGFLGFGSITPGPLPSPGFQSNFLTRGNVTYYFRTEFDFSGETIGSQIIIDHVVDDGVVYYLNGQELGRVRLAAGAITYLTGAETQSPEDEEELAAINTSASGSLVNGTNVLAAEVHNQSAGSSDLIFGARVHITEGTGAPSPDDASPAWVRRSLPSSTDWIMQTEVKLEKDQFGEFLAGLLVEASENGSPVRYGIGFDGGEEVVATRGGTAGVPATLASAPAIASHLATIRLQRSGDQLLFAWDDGGGFTQIHQATLPANTTFTTGGVFVATPDDEQTVEASFDYLMLVDSTPVSTIPLVVSEIMYNPTGPSS
ncbi:MAG: hypothetical protein ACI9UA_002785, partial [Pseudoalteromonas tetraodonis]